MLDRDLVRLYFALSRQSWVVFRRGWLSVIFALVAPFAMAVLFASLTGRAVDAPPWTLSVAVVVDAPGQTDRPWADLDSLRSVELLMATRRDAEERLRQGTVAAILEYVHVPASGAWHVVATASGQWRAVINDLIDASASSCGPACEIRFETPPDESTSLPWVVAGVLTMALGNIAFFVVAQNTAMARQDGSLLMYAITPITAKMYFAAEVSVMAAVGMAQALLTLLLLALISDFAVTGSWVGTIGIVFLSSLALLGMGLLVAGVLPSAPLVFAVAPFLNVICLAIGNVFWPASSIEWLRPIVLALPTTYAADALRQVLTNDSGLFPIWLDITVLLGILALTYLGVGRFFRFDAGSR